MGRSSDAIYNYIHFFSLKWVTTYELTNQDPIIDIDEVDMEDDTDDTNHLFIHS